MKEATGIKSISPNRIATEKSVAMYKDHMVRVDREKMKKEAMRKDLERQM